MTTLDPVLAERRQLTAIAFRMLGTLADAEDAVQEAYVRWYRLDEAERDAILAPGAWLTRVVGRICLDVLGSARARRERYVGPWLPEPVPAFSAALGSDAADPQLSAELEESVSAAILVVLESLTPAERVVFVLREVFAMPFAEVAEVVGRSVAACRQLAVTARRRVDERRSRIVSRAEHDAAVIAFAEAVQGGDLRAVIAALDADAVLRSDGGGRVTAARNAVVGADRVARFLLGIAEKNPDAVIEPRALAGAAGFAIVTDGVVTGVVTLAVERGAVAEIGIVLNPEKLGLWNE